MKSQWTLRWQVWLLPVVVNLVALGGSLANGSYDRAVRAVLTILLCSYIAILTYELRRAAS